MDEVRRPARYVGERGQIEDVAGDELHVRMIRERSAGERITVEVVEEDDLVGIGEPLRERRADAPGTTGDHDPLSGQRHAPSLDVRVYRPACAAGRRDSADRRIYRGGARLIGHHEPPRHRARPPGCPYADDHAPLRPIWW